MYLGVVRQELLIRGDRGSKNLLFYLIVVLVDLLLEVILQLSFALQENFLPQESL